MGKLAMALVGVWAVVASGETATAPLPPGTLRIEYHMSESSPQLLIAWSTRATQGKLTRTLTASDRAALADFAHAAATPGSDWRPGSAKAAALLLDGISPLDKVQRVAIALAGARLLEQVPFEALGNPPLIERFAVWYEPLLPGQAMGLFEAAELPRDRAKEFSAAYQRALKAGLDPPAAIREVKIAWLRSGDERAHPALWAAVRWRGGMLEPVQAHGLWPWAAGISSLLAAASVIAWFAFWWRRQRFELW